MGIDPCNHSHVLVLQPEREEFIGAITCSVMCGVWLEAETCRLSEHTVVHGLTLVAEVLQNVLCLMLVVFNLTVRTQIPASFIQA